MKKKSNSEFIQEISHDVQLAWRLLRDPRVPTYLKVSIPAVAALYVILPLDIIPDMLPIIGQLDDLAVIILGIRLFIQLAPKEVVAEHETALRRSSKSDKKENEKVIDADYQVK